MASGVISNFFTRVWIYGCLVYVFIFANPVEGTEYTHQGTLLGLKNNREDRRALPRSQDGQPGSFRRVFTGDKRQKLPHLHPRPCDSVAIRAFASFCFGYLRLCFRLRWWTPTLIGCNRCWKEHGCRRRNDSPGSSTVLINRRVSEVMHFATFLL